MKRVCSYCKGSLGPDKEPLDNPAETHGICDTCGHVTPAGTRAPAKDGISRRTTATPFSASSLKYPHSA